MMKRIEFDLPYKVKRGEIVLNLMGQQVGHIVEITQMEASDHEFVKWHVQADVNDDTDPTTVQVLEPLTPPQ